MAGDSLYGGDGNDLVTGTGALGDELYGGSGNDTLIGAGNATLYGGPHRTHERGAGKTRRAEAGAWNAGRGAHRDAQPDGTVVSGEPPDRSGRTGVQGTVDVVMFWHQRATKGLISLENNFNQFKRPCPVSHNSSVS